MDNTPKQMASKNRRISLQMGEDNLDKVAEVSVGTMAAVCFRSVGCLESFTVTYLGFVSFTLCSKSSRQRKFSLSLLFNSS
jgi:hypothetical protein